MSAKKWGLAVGALVASVIVGAARDAAAGTKTWDGGGGNNNWNTANNWAPNGVPANGDDVTIATGDTVTLNANTASLRTLTITGGSLTANTGRTITTTTTFSVSGGTFTGSSGNISVGTNLSISGTGNFTASSGTMSVAGSFSRAGSGTWSANTGEVSLTGTGTVSNTGSFVDLTVAASGTYTASSALSATGTLTVSSGTLSVGTNSLSPAALTISGGTLTMGANTTTVSGTVTLSSGSYTASSLTTNVGGSFTRSGGTFSSSNGTVKMTGSGSITSSGASFYALTIASSGAYTLSDQLSTIAGLTISSGTLTAGSFATSVGGTFSQTGGTFNANTSTLTVTGVFSHTAGTFNAGTSTLALNGTGALSHTFGGATLNRVIIGTDQGLVGYWKLDETSGAAIADSSGYGNNGTVVGGFGRTTPSSRITFSDPEAMTFDGTTYSTLGVTGMPANNAPQTMSAWIYLNANTGVQNFMALINPTGTTNAAQIGIRDDTYCPNSPSPCLDVWEFGGTSLAYTSIPSAGTWHHVAYTYDGTTSKVYLDSVVGTTTGNATQTATPSYVYLGSYNGIAEFLNGALDDVRVYNRALSATEISTLYSGHDLSYGTGGTHTFTDAFVASDDLLINTGILTGTHTLSVGGSWINNGGIFTGTGTVTMTGTIAGGAILSHGSSFASLTINGSGGTYSAVDPLVVTGSLTISAATATLAGAATIQVGGSWSNSGTFNGTGTVTLTGSGTLKSNGSRFAALTISASGTYTTSDRLWVPGGTVTFTSGTLALGTNGARVGNFAISPGTTFTNSGTLTLDGAGNQTLPFSSYGGALRLEDTTETNLVAYWKLDAGFGYQIYDFSGNGNNGTLSGTSWQTGIGLTSFGFEDPYSLVLNGSSGVGSIPAATIPRNDAAQTVSFWMNPASVSGTEDVIVFDNTVTGDGIKIGIKSSTVTVWTYSAGTTLIQGSTTLTTGTWYHVSYTYDGAGNQGLTVTPFTSGVAGTTTTTTATATNPSYTPSYAYLGTNSPSNTELYNGALDEVRVYNAVLTATQIAQLRAGHYAGTGGTTPTYTASSTTTATGLIYVDNVSFDGTGKTVTANAGLTVNTGGTLTVGASSLVSIAAGQTLTVDGTLNASSTATIKAGSGAFFFKVGSSTSVTPTVNISGLTVTGTNGGMQIGAAGTATPTITQFDNVVFSGGTGAQYLLIKSSSLMLYSTGCQFDAGKTTGGATKAVVMIGNNGTTRALFGSTVCATNWQVAGTVCDDSKAKTDDDSNADGVADSPSNGVNNGAVVQFVRAYEKDTAGSVIGFPAAAFNWNTYAYYSTYVAFHNASGGTADVIYVRDESGNPLYSWPVPAGETITGTPQWITDSAGTTHYVYVATTQGHVYRLIDNATGTTSGSLTADASWGTNPYDCSCTIKTPLAMDSTNLYWNSTTGGNTFWTLGQATQSHPTPVALPATVISTGLTVASLYGTKVVPDGTTYAYLGTTGDFLRINVLSQTTVDANSSPGAASIRGRVVVGYNKQGTYRVYGGDDGGHMWALDATTGFTTTNGLWKYPASGAGSAVNSSPYYDHDTDTLQYGTDTGSIISLNAATGAAVNAAYPYTPAGGSGDKITAEPLYYNGVLVIGSTGGKLYFLDRNTGGTTPSVAIIKEYNFGTSESVSGVGFDSQSNRYMVSTANSSTNDGHLYYFDPVTDPSSGTL